MPKMKRVTAVAGGSVVHVETPLGIVNITAGLADHEGRRVDSIAISPDNGVTLDGAHNVRLVEPKVDESINDLDARLNPVEQVAYVVVMKRPKGARERGDAPKIEKTASARLHFTPEDAAEHLQSLAAGVVRNAYEVREIRVTFT